MRSTVDLVAADLRHLWHPFTQQQDWGENEPALVIEGAEGTNLYDTDGRAYIDGVSSLWCNVHGHRHPAIDSAIRTQLDQVAHTTMLGLSHRPAIELAEKLIAVAPPGLARVFYSDSGSTAVEIALKMVYQWWAQRGEPQRTGFVCLHNAYHGDTLGAVTVGGVTQQRAAGEDHRQRVGHVLAQQRRRGPVWGLGHRARRVVAVVEGEQHRLGAGDRAEHRQDEIRQAVAVAIERRDDQRRVGGA